MTQPERDDLVERVGKRVHEMLSRANINAYLDMPVETADVIARAVIPIVGEACAKVADDELVEVCPDDPNETDITCNAIVSHVAQAIRTTTKGPTSL